MNKKIVQIDNYDQVELWADGKCQLRLLWDQERKQIDYLVSGKLALESSPEPTLELPVEPGIIKALREEGI